MDLSVGATSNDTNRCLPRRPVHRRPQRPDEEALDTVSGVSRRRRGRFRAVTWSAPTLLSAAEAPLRAPTAAAAVAAVGESGGGGGARTIAVLLAGIPRGATLLS